MEEVIDFTFSLSVSPQRAFFMDVDQKRGLLRRIWIKLDVVFQFVLSKKNEVD